jgi:hypothetical protein
MAEVNAGLGSLAELKDFLLAKSMSSVADTANDTTIMKIGAGVAGMMADHCNRDWDYGEGKIDEFTANRAFIVARQYPLNLEIPIVIERCDSLVGGVQQWTPLPGAAYNIAAQAGIVYLSGVQGDFMSRLRMTSAGGYWWEGLDANATPPTGAARVPHALRLAWLLQCQALWLVRDDLGTAIAGSSGGNAILGLSLPGYDLIPEVQALLSKFIRYGMSG